MQTYGENLYPSLNILLREREREGGREGGREGEREREGGGGKLRHSHSF